MGFIDFFIEFWPELNKAFFETLLMVGIAVAIAILIGMPLGIVLYITDHGQIIENKFIRAISGLVTNLVRSIPFIILLVFLLPLTDKIVGTTIGPTAASVPLSVAAIPFFARIVESAAREIDRGVIEAAVSVGAHPWTIIKDIILPEARPAIISGLTITIISLVGYSAMAGIVGGGGIGDLAIRYGYYRYDNNIMYTTVIVLIVIVQVIQFSGDLIAKKVNKR
ncbi:MAG TPA: methionine ABC transporter permease [Pseudogracilibacillus sp.]|nr:methionine ABC transporter permease [Pseudogracilibacillus sp.]